MITLSHFPKRKYTELKLNKRKDFVRGKKLSQLGAFPLKLQDDVLQWKICVNYDAQANHFILHINDLPFDWMPYQSQVIPTGPMNIKYGKIRLNKVRVHKNFAQYTSDTVALWQAEHNLQPTTDLFIGEFFACSSAEVVNSLFEELVHTIDEESGLKVLELNDFVEMDNL